jgi:hypothetical protein
MTEADLSPLLSKPTPEQKDKDKDKKEKKDKKDKKEKKDKKDKKDKKEKKDKKDKDKEGKKEKKRSRQEMEEEEDEIEDKVIEQVKSNGVEESTETKKRKSKPVAPRSHFYADIQDGKHKKRKIVEAEEATSKVVDDSFELDEKSRRKLERKKAKQEARAARKGKIA